MRRKSGQGSSDPHTNHSASGQWVTETVIGSDDEIDWFEAHSK